MHRILLAEDDDAIVRLLTDFLREEGFAVTAAAGERSAREALERERFDLALVDLQLADGSGFGVCAAARARQLPGIFLTASSDESTVVSGFDMGADDYVAKPFRPRELVSRIRSVLRRAGDRDYAAAELAVPSPKEAVLIRKVGDFPKVVAEAARTYSPALVANYCYDLAKEYNQFYHDYPMLREKDEAKRNLRLLLSQVVARTLRSAA